MSEANRSMQWHWPVCRKPVTLEIGMREIVRAFQYSWCVFLFVTWMTGDQGASASELHIDQIGGVGNLASVRQSRLLSAGRDGFYIETDGAVSPSLSAWLLQAGDLNVMLVRQIGQGNFVGSLDAQQVGAGNFSSLIQINSEAYPIGSVALPGHNRLDLLQHGQNNIGYLSQRGTNNLMFGVQRGADHNADIAQGRLIPSNYNEAGFGQHGAGNTVRITQD